MFYNVATNCKDKISLCRLHYVVNFTGVAVFFTKLVNDLNCCLGLEVWWTIRHCKSMMLLLVIRS